MAAYKKSAKDIAFDKERARLNKRIRDLETVLVENANLKREMDEKDRKIREQSEWIDRLLEYMDMSEADMRRKIESDKKLARMIGMLSML